MTKQEQGKVEVKVQETVENTKGIAFIKKRDERIVSFDKEKISNAIFKSAKAVGGADKKLADELADTVHMYLNGAYDNNIPGIEDIQDIVEKVLIETGHAKTSKAYILYRNKKKDLRKNIKIRKPVQDKADSTDVALLVAPVTKDKVFKWDNHTIKLQKYKQTKVMHKNSFNEIEITWLPEKRLTADIIEGMSLDLNFKKKYVFHGSAKSGIA